jgi:hypothetical protein
MLGLAASHLSLCGETDYSAQALSHRVHAITLLNQALSKPCKSKVEADARYATVMTLVFQSSYMPEGMVEFMIMIRGCTAVSDAILPRLENSLFEGFTAESHNKHVLSLNPVDVVEEIADILGDGLVSVSRLRPIAQSIVEVKYLSILERILKIAGSSPVQGTTTMLRSLPRLFLLMCFNSIYGSCPGVREFWRSVTGRVQAFHRSKKLCCPNHHSPLLHDRVHCRDCRTGADHGVFSLSEGYCFGMGLGSCRKCAP